MSRPLRLLVTDLDGTLLGDRDALAHLCNLFSRDDAPALAFATGRQRESAVTLLEQWNVSCGDFLIAGVGSEIYERTASGWNALPWPPDNERWDAERVRAALAGLPLEPQPVSSPVKVSYVATPESAAHAVDRLESLAIDANVVHSHGDLLDVLPSGVDKGSAVSWLTRHLEIDSSAVITCGDTENDLAMLALSCASIIVSNARREVRAAAASMEHVYIAGRPHAGGILEGLRRYGWLTPDGWSRIEPRRYDRDTNSRYLS